MLTQHIDPLLNTIRYTTEENNLIRLCNLILVSSILNLLLIFNDLKTLPNISSTIIDLNRMPYKPSTIVGSITKIVRYALVINFLNHPPQLLDQSKVRMHKPCNVVGIITRIVWYALGN